MPNEAPAVTCPKCGASFALDAALAAPMLKQVELAHAAEMSRAVEAAKLEVVDSAYESAEARHKKAQESSARLAEQLRESARQAEASNRELRSALDAAQQEQVKAIKHERELADKERELDLTIEQRVSSMTSTIRQQAATQADEANRLKLLEKNTLLQSLEAKVNDLQTKLTQGSQQLQGEVQELDLEARLKVLFPFDTIGEVAKGIRGADFGQTVVAPSGTGCGLILYESKRTRNWSQGWLAKLRADGREARADVLVLVSQVVPEEVESFALIDGIWVCQMKYAFALAAVLRDALLRVNVIKQVQAGMATKSELVYQYLTSQQFRRRIEAVVESFTTQQSDLDAEKRAIMRAWAKRTAQIENALTAVTGLVGDLQGVGGDSMLEIEGMSLRALGGGDV